jgi:hypothetical protein
MSEEQFEEFVKKAATGYRKPPPTPREEIWKRIEAARRDPTRRQSTLVIDLASRRKQVRRWATIILAAAALVTLGVAIGRLSLTPPVEAPVIATAPPADSAPGTDLLHVAAVATLSQVATLFTDYDSDRITDDFRANARDLLSETRLLLGSQRLADPQLKKLLEELEDLELLLVQVARLRRTGQGEERAFIDDGMADRAIRQRLRNAIPAGPAA